jgi:hypothetical protein
MPRLKPLHQIKNRKRSKGKMKITRRKSLLVVGVLAIALSLINASSCGTSAATAATAVNKYANSLSAVQDAEIKWHGLGKIDDVSHIKFQKDMKTASTAGKSLDAAITLAAQGADSSMYVTAAEKAFTDISADIHFSDPATQMELTTLVQAAGDLLQNSIALIHQIKGNPSPIKPSPAAPGGLALFLGFGVMGFAAIGVGLSDAVKLLSLITTLEPIAFNLILQLAQSMKGKSVEEIVALNEQLFGKVNSTADAEIAATQAADALQPLISLQSDTNQPQLTSLLAWKNRAK